MRRRAESARSRANLEIGAFELERHRRSSKRICLQAGRHALRKVPQILLEGTKFADVVVERRLGRYTFGVAFRINRARIDAARKPPESQTLFAIAAHALAAELVQRRVTVLVATGGELSALAAKQATSTIPIVFVTGDPVKAGLVESLNRPGGNATGSYIVTTEMEQKRFSLLHELTPGVSLIGALINPDFAVAARQLREVEEAARTIGRPLLVAKASNDEELNAAFALLLRQGIGALLVGADAYFDTRRDRIIAFAAQYRLPAVYHFREYAFAGGLVSYGPSITDAYRQAGNYTGRVLRGEKPADLPVVLTTKFDFVVNMKTAKALGFKFPPALLARVDEVIE